MNRRKVAAQVSVLGILVPAGAFLATQHEWPFSKPSTRSGDQANHGSSKNWTGPQGDQTRPAEEIWSGEVSLVLNQRYGLNKKPIKALEPCGACLTVGSRPGGGLFLHSDNGILPWSKRDRPSYYDCIRQRESGTLDVVTLETSPHDGGLAVHGWLCATGNEDDIIRLRYEGQGQSHRDCRFAVTAWHRPFV